MLVAQLVPESVKLAVVRAMYIVRELVQHRINNLLEREEQGPVARVPEAKAYLLATVDVEA